MNDGAFGLARRGGERDLPRLGIGIPAPALLRFWTMLAHPKCGASWEGYAIEETLKAVQPDEAYFWATHQGAELDLLLIRDGRRLGVEIKRMDAPTLTASMRIALEDLKLERLVVFYPGTTCYPLSDRATVMPLSIAGEGDADAVFPRRRRTPSPTSRFFPSPPGGGEGRVRGFESR